MRRNYTSLIGLILVMLFATACKPVADSQSVEVLANQSVEIELTGSDRDGDPLTFSITTPPSNGTVSGNPPIIVYTPNSGFVGQDSIGFVANDGSDNSSEATVSITVNPPVTDDADGDGVVDVDDAFPNDPSEIYDSNNDGVGNYQEKDEDQDGTPDTADGFPFDESQQAMPLISEIEFNDNPTDATVIDIKVPFQVSGVIQEDIDGDYFKFSVAEPTTLSARLAYTSVEFEPALAILDAAGNSLPTAMIPMGAQKVAVAANLLVAGDYYVVVNDFNSKGDASFTYSLDLFVDKDTDGLADTTEEAFGINREEQDSDSDGISDGIEFFHAELGAFDLDGDGIPNWLDKDSDGDGVSDLVETDQDADLDGIANYLDLDSDGNGLLDSVEAGLGSTPVDSDADGIFDFADLDDDNDGLRDDVDNDRLQAVEISDPLDPDNRLVVDQAVYQRADFVAVNTAPEGSEISIQGLGFAATNEANLVVFKTSQGFVAVSPLQSADSSLTVVLPTGDVTSVFVVTNNIRSNSVELSVVPEGSPFLYEPTVSNVLVGSTLVLQGENFSSPMVLNIGGVSAEGFDVTEFQASFTIPSDIVSSDAQVTTAQGVSNKIQLIVDAPINVNVTPAVGVSVNPGDFLLSADAFADIPLNDTWGASVNINQVEADIISLIKTGEVEETLYMQAVSTPAMDLVEINSESTALAMIYQASFVVSGLEVDKLEQNWSALGELDEVKALASFIEQQLATNPEYWSSPTAEYIQLLGEAIRAVEAVYEAAGLRVSAASVDLQGPDITPPQHDVSVFAIETGAFGGEFTGNVGVENDTQLFLSTKIVDIETDAVLYDHITGYFDTNMVGPQRFGVLYYASTKADYNQCQFKDCRVEVLTPNGAIAGDQAKILGAKTLIERVVHPIMELSLDKQFNPNDLTKILINVAPAVVNSIGVEVTQGDTTEAAKILVDTLLDDFRTAPKGGPISQALVKLIGANLSESFRDAILKRIGTKAVPILGQISLALDAVGAAGTFWSVGLVASDLATIPGQLDFDVIWPMQIADITPKTVSINDGDTLLLISGQGLTKATEVMVADEGPNGVAPIVINVATGTSSARSIELTIPGAFIEQAVGPLKIYARNPEVTVIADDMIEVVAEPTIRALLPDEGGAGDIIEIDGAGFHPSRFDNIVTFQGENGRISAAILESSRQRIKVQVPAGVVTGDVTVETDGVLSNGVEFTVEEGNVVIDFGDNGNLNDDTFGLYVDNQLIHAMPAPTRNAGPFSIRLSEGAHNVTLRGITAPDDVGTYFIEFSGEVLSVSGDPLTAADLFAGVEKQWVIEVGRSNQFMPSRQEAPSAKAVRWAE